MKGKDFIILKGRYEFSWKPVFNNSMKNIFLDTLKILIPVIFYSSAIIRSYNPILRTDKPHEMRFVHLYGSVIKDPTDGLIKMWYSCHGGPDKGGCLALAVSEDGYNFIKPDLDVVPYTNIVMDNAFQVHGPSIIYDNSEMDPKRRYKLIMRPTIDPKRINSYISNCINSYISENGINWRFEKNLMFLNSDSHIGLCRNHHFDCYQATFRKIRTDRRVWTSISKDFIHWDEPRLVLEPQINDGVQTQLYGMQISTYGPYIMGWISMYYTSVDDLGWGKMDGVRDIQVAFSRDGFLFHRIDADNHLIAPSYSQGDFDACQVLPASAPVLLESRIMFYYGGFPNCHSGPYDCGYIGLAELRPDGFTGLQADNGTGIIITRPFCVDRPGIFINADVSKGECKVSICKADGTEINGLSQNDCVSMSTDSIHHRLRFKSGYDETMYTNMPIRLKIFVKHGTLYSITMSNGLSNTKYWDFNEIKCVDPFCDLQLNQ